eukprot:516458_1
MCKRTQRFSVFQNYGVTECPNTKSNSECQQNKGNDSKDTKDNGSNDENKKNHQNNDESKDEKNNKENDEDNKENNKDNKENDEDKTHSDTTETTIVKPSDTFLDELYEFMLVQRMKSTETLKTFFDTEHYDSDGVFDDIGDGFGYCNIATNVRSSTHYSLIVNYVISKRVTCFSIGYIFYYWQYYKYQTDSIFAQEHDYYWNKNDHSG